MIKCAILNHEPQTVELLKKYIDQTGSMKLVFVSSNPIELFNFLLEAVVDTILLDIQIPKLTGLQFMRIATNKYPVIITSSYMEKAIKGYELNVIDFLLKPITFDRFYKSLLKLEAQKIKKTRNARLMPTSNLSDYLFIKTSGKLRKINYHEIVYIEDNHECVLIHTIEEALLCIESFIEIEEILPKGQFLKIDSRYIIALTKIDFVEKTRLSIKNTFLPIDVDYKEALFKIISKLQ